MVGSLKNAVYITDSGDEFYYETDEGWLEAIVAAGGGTPGTADYTTTSTAKYSIPGNVQPRTVSLTSSDNRKRAKVVVPTLAIYNAISNSGSFSVVDADNGGTINLFLSLKDGERVEIPKAADTALLDGDAT